MAWLVQFSALGVSVGCAYGRKAVIPAFVVSVAALRLVFSWGVAQEEHCITGDDFPAHLKCWCFESLGLLKHGELRRPHVSVIRGGRAANITVSYSQRNHIRSALFS